MKKILYGTIGATLLLPLAAMAGDPGQCVDCPTVSVPEPSTFALLAAGLAVAALMKFKNRNK